MFLFLKCVEEAQVESSDSWKLRKHRWKVLVPGMSWISAVKMSRSRNEMEKKSNLVPRMIRKGQEDSGS
jgi:hypothetical protein